MCVSSISDLGLDYTSTWGSLVGASTVEQGNIRLYQLHIALAPKLSYVIEKDRLCV